MLDKPVSVANVIIIVQLLILMLASAINNYRVCDSGCPLCQPAVSTYLESPIQLQRSFLHGDAHNELVNLVWGGGRTVSLFLL